MTVEIWDALAFAAGLGAVVAYYKHSRWLAALIALALPVALVGVLGWPHDADFRDTSALSVVLWGALAFVGAATATAAIILRIIR